MSALPPSDLPGATATLGALLVCGHLLSDFALQSTWMVRHKARRPSALLAHAAVVFAVQAACVLTAFRHPFGLVLAAGIAALHAAIDLAKGRAAPRFALAPFLADQLLHLATLALALRLWLWRFGGPPPTPLGPDALAAAYRTAVLVGAYAFNWNGASAIVTSVLASVGADASEPTGERPARVGRVIGILERMLVLTAVSLGQWGAVGFVVAAKSIARFSQLEDRSFAETYLVGTMTSVLLAVASGWLVGALTA